MIKEDLLNWYLHGEKYHAQNHQGYLNITNIKQIFESFKTEIFYQSTG